MAELCDLQIHINGQQTFFLNERIISKFSGKIRKIIKKEKRRTQIKNSEIQIDDFPGGTDGFELISRFCYNNATTTINISNISLLHCCALFLGMTEKLSPCNLLQQTETFLEGMAYWSWNDILICLKSCESFFSYADSYGLIQKLLTSLLAKISQNSEIFLSSSSSSSSSPETTSSFRQSSSTKSTTPEVLGIKNNSSRKSWWFEDLTILPPMIIERFVMTLGAYGTDNNSLVLTRFLLNYLKSIAQSKHGLINKTCSKYEYAGLADTSVYGVLFIGKSSFSCRVLFWVLRLVSGFGISRDCRTGLERLIGSVLDQATLDDLLVSGNDGNSVYDVNLVVRLIRLFVHSYNKEEYLQKMKKVGWLIDMYLGEIAPDQNLKISKFLGVAESLADCARDCFDGIYRAVDLYLEPEVVKFNLQKKVLKAKQTKQKTVMAVSMRDLDPAFQGAGQKAGIEIWRIENFRPVSVSKSSHGKFFTGDSYVILKTTALKSGALRHDIHYWLGKDTSQDEAGTAAMKTVELDAALGGRAVQYREVQGHETEKFLSYFKPCIIPQEGGIASGFKHAEAEEHKTRLYVCKGKHVVHVKEVAFARSSLNHDDIFIVDTVSKIFQFNGSNSSIQERAKALEVVQYIKDTYHDGKCEIAAIEDGKMMADAETGEFWGLFGGFAPLPRKTATEDAKSTDAIPTRLFGVAKGQADPIDVVSLTRELLDTNKCYLLDCGLEVYVWMGRNTSLDDRKSASGVAEELLSSLNRPKAHIVRVMEGFETVMFRSKFDSWHQSTDVAVSEDGRGKVAALLKRQGLNVKGLLKTAPAKEEPQPHIDCTGNLQVWRVDGEGKTPLSGSDLTKFYSGDCYIFQYSYPGETGEEYLVGTWFGEQSVEEDRSLATSQASKIVESLKFLPAQARIFEGNESIQFFSIFQSFIVFKGGVSDGYKKHVAEKELPDITYSEDGLALFRVQGTGPENMQAIQVEAVASSLNSSYCYILHNGSCVFTWFGNLTTSEDQELVERQLDLIKPNMQSKPQKEGSESEQFWELLGGKSEYPSQKVGRDVESDPHLFSCSFSNDLKATEIYNFDQDDLMTEDVFILDCHSDVFVWVGQQVSSKNRNDALTIGEKFLERDFLLEKLSRQTPIYIVMEGSEPTFFTRFFTWDSTKSAMHGNSFMRKLTIVKNGGTPILDKPKRRTSVSYGGRSAVVPEKSQRSRSVSFSPDRVRVRGRSPAFNALAATFENPNARNLSTPPPVVKKLYPKSGSPDSAKLASRSSAIAALTSTFDKPTREPLIPRSVKASPKAPKPTTDTDSKENSMSSRIEALTIKEDVKEGEADDEEGLPVYPYDRLTILSMNPVTEIDVTKRETYLSSEEFREKFGMAKDAFYKLPKWKQNKLKMALQLF